MDKKILKIMALCIVAHAAIAKDAKDDAKAETTKFYEQTVGASLGYYRYAEPTYMALKGTMFGLDYTGQLNLNKFFVRGEFIYNYGKHKYNSNGTGSMNNLPSWYLDNRVLGGIKFETANQRFSPFLGLAFRYLHNDNSGKISTTGNPGYLRVNKLFYAPVGLMHQVRFSNGHYLESTAEYDQLITGRQESGDSPVLVNKQTKGWGMRVSTYYNTKSFAFGPYFRYWNISQSDIVQGWAEPNNRTVEVGVRFAYKF